MPDLYCSGPPCQPFSAMGQQQGIADKTFGDPLPRTFVIEKCAADRYITKAQIPFCCGA